MGWVKGEWCWKVGRIFRCKLLVAGKTGIYSESQGGSWRAEREGAWREGKFNLSALTWCWGEDRKGHGTTSKRLRVLPFPEVTVIGMRHMGSLSPLTTSSLRSCYTMSGAFQMKYPPKSSSFSR